MNMLWLLNGRFVRYVNIRSSTMRINVKKLKNAITIAVPKYV